MKTHRFLPGVVFLSFACLAVVPGRAEPPSGLPGSFVPDPATIQRFGKGYRYPQKGWIVVHLEGAPYERGVQHGRLLAPEIAGWLAADVAEHSSAAPGDAWKLVRTTVNTAFLRKFDREFLEEMKGIADGAAAAGARFEGRPLDVLDIAAINLWAELMTLDAANEATPDGLEGIDFTTPKPGPADHCSAFAATGKATADGRPVIGHISMFDLNISRWFNVWLDIKPEHGHRVVMQSYPAGIYSGMDYYLNDVGIAMVETTIAQTRFDISGEALASRARKALQYSESIDDVVGMLKAGNNGLYNNEWLLADMKTDEIAMFELGTHTSKLWRSSKDEWFGGTAGFYWGCNNEKDLGLRLETIKATNDTPANLVWHPSDRDLKWQELYRAHCGKIDAAFAKEAFTTAPLCSSFSLDAKYTTAKMAKDMLSCALFGPPREHTWMPTAGESHRFKDIGPLVSNPWTVLGAAAAVDQAEPRTSNALTSVVVDLPDPSAQNFETAFSGSPKDDEQGPAKPAWHGTLLPAADGDVWLATAFAEYEGVVNREQLLAGRKGGKELSSEDYEQLAIPVHAARTRYFAGVRRAGGDMALAEINQDPANDAWYKIASGKGLLVMADLRRLMGHTNFVAMMDEFGRRHAGQKVSSSEFSASAARHAGKDLSGFFEYWLHSTGLPRVELESASSSSNSVQGVLRAQTGRLPEKMEATVEYAEGEMTCVTSVAPNGSFKIQTTKPAKRLVIDKYGRMARANGNHAYLGAWNADLEHTMIVYGTSDDEAGNREAAEVCQRAVRNAWYNLTLPIASDTEVTENALKSQNLILIGRPAANSITKRFAKALPIEFGSSTFEIGGQKFAHAGSAVIAAGTNPLEDRLTITLLAGNSATATFLRAGDALVHTPPVDALVYDAKGSTKAIVATAPELTKTF